MPDSMIPPSKLLPLMMAGNGPKGMYRGGQFAEGLITESCGSKGTTSPSDSTPCVRAIATTGGREQTKKLLGVLRVPANYVVVTGGDVEKVKPSPDIFVAAGQPPQHTRRAQHCLG